MLGDQIGEETGKIAVMRVLDANGPKVEVSARTQGKVLGIDYQGRTTYTSEVQPGGHIFGEGQGVYLTADGMAAWKGQGTGRFNPGGGASYRGTIHYVSATGSLAKLAGTVGAFEYSTDANDNAVGKVWEWK
jgi:hypothetical protein